MTPYGLRVGERGPVQHSATTCGSLVLVVARMLTDPAFAARVRTGEGTSTTASTSADQRLAALERDTLRRTAASRRPDGRLRLPWPPALGTSPWGARDELEHVGASYEVAWCRTGGPEGRRRHLEVVSDRVTPGRPAALYVGSAHLPRHVTLLLRPEPGAGLALYDPADGLVRAVDRDAFAAARLRVAGWDVPWCTVRPRGGVGLGHPTKFSARSSLRYFAGTPPRTGDTR